jgi:hypothetical protein
MDEGKTMSDYYDKRKRYKQRGIDWDLHEALENNPQLYTVDDIDSVLAAYEGNSDDEPWRWIVKLKNTRIVLLIGGHGYTGWDYAWLESHLLPDYVSETDNDFAYHRITDYEEDSDVVKDLVGQIKSGKRKTWRDETDEIMGDLNEIELPDKGDV